MVRKNVIPALKMVFSSRRYSVLAAVSFTFFFALYLFTLPATYTGGRIGFVSLKFITPVLAAFSLVNSLLISLIIPVSAYSFWQGLKVKKAGGMGFLGSVFPPLACCSPLIPSLLAPIAAISPLAINAGAVQGFIATYELYILLASAFILAYALFQSAKSVSPCCVYEPEAGEKE